MIKQQIIMDTKRIAEEGRYDAKKVQDFLDEFMTTKIGFKKEMDGFYVGQGQKDDFAKAGFAMTELRQKSWFMRYVKTWLHYNSDDSDNPNDFAVEDFKEYNMASYGAGY